MDCWCVKYHTFKLGTHELVDCECTCHNNAPPEDGRYLRNYLDLEAERISEQRLNNARLNLQRRGIILPTRTAHYLLTEAYVDDYPERWIESGE